MATKCVSCNNSYPDIESHLERQPLCKRWVDLLSSSPLAAAITKLDISNEDSSNHRDTTEHICPCCRNKYSTVGNLNKHLRQSKTCSKYSKYCALLPIINAMEPVDTSMLPGKSHSHLLDNAIAFTPSPNTFMHIIWNIFLMDKDHILTEEEAITNNIAHIIAILPDESEYKQTISCSRDIMLYTGHSMDINTDQYDEYIHKMESYRKERKNVFIFCNNGYQRSIPFLCYYLTKHHHDEVPNVERAIDIILPQVDKANYATMRGKLITQVETLFAHNHIE